MRKSSPQRVHDVIGHTMTLQKLHQKTRLLTQWEQALKSILPVNLQSVVRLANYRHHRFIIEVASAIWLTQLRYEQSQILSALRHSVLPELSGLEFVINPDMYRPLSSTSVIKQTKQTQRILSKTSAQLIENLAKECKEGLKDKLIKLAQHAKKTNNNK